MNKPYHNRPKHSSQNTTDTASSSYNDYDSTRSQIPPEDRYPMISFFENLSPKNDLRKRLDDDDLDQMQDRTKAWDYYAMVYMEIVIPTLEKVKTPDRQAELSARFADCMLEQRDLRMNKRPST